METVGIGITTRNRNDVLGFVVEKHLEFNVPGANYLIVDDNSSCDNRGLADLLGGFMYLNPRRGIAKAKNACIKNLDVDHLFLFDDDCFPIKDEWWKPWVESGVEYMIFASPKTITVKEKKNGLTYWNGHHGCAIYMTRKCIETVGGFDKDFGTYGFEHAELTWRVKRAGLIEHDFISPDDLGLWAFDVDGSIDGFEWLHKSSIMGLEKDKAIAVNNYVLGKVMSKTSIYRDI